MKLISEKTYSDIFFIGSLWNLAIGLGCLTTFKLSMRLIYGAKAVTSSIVATLPLRFFYAAVAIFGWGYYMVSKDLKKNRGIVWMAIVAKLTIFNVRSASSLFISAKRILHPLFARAIEMALPRPDAAPVITAFFPSDMIIPLSPLNQL